MSCGTRRKQWQQKAMTPFTLSNFSWFGYAFHSSCPCELGCLLVRMHKQTPMR